MSNSEYPVPVRTQPGEPYSLGSNLDALGCNFAVFSKNAISVELLFFETPEKDSPSQRFLLDSTLNKTGDIWHIWVEGVKAGQLYGYCVDGPWAPQSLGHRFNPYQLLLDPYGKAVVGNYHWNDQNAYAYVWGDPKGDLSFNRTPNLAQAVKSAVVAPSNFSWERDKPLQIPLKDTIIYEAHVRAFTQDPSSGVQHPGTFLGMIEKIPYIKDLGVTSVELLPIHEFNPHENVRTNPETGEPLFNFWGYSTVSFFSPCSWYASDGDGRTAVSEFKQMVAAFHKAGLEIILDVVFNHTAEGNEYGPTFSFRGFDNSIYYMLEWGRHYKNYSGCGNTLNCNHPVVRRLILDSLRYWVVDMHVDGFRFDLAAILGRGTGGEWIPNYSVLNDIAHDPILSKTKIIAEGWDAAGLFKVGDFPSGWAEWNSHFRDDVRCAVKSDEGVLPRLATRLSGSSDLFHYAGRKPYHGINFITAHDGFTLQDLVSYNHKHNWANAENNLDGSSWNLSWNCGHEGLTGDAMIQALRRKQKRNLAALLMLSMGTPMLLAGDEMSFTKFGNNNTYCHDNRLNWLDWALLQKDQGFHGFIRFLNHFRRRHPTLRRENFLQGVAHSGSSPD
ncbi:MAG: glycogen debranching protein GlgX, partial [Spirochaetales bacterium]|nr:glycogen debranching protein GlgX [Spirochaetales bacterium]